MGGRRAMGVVDGSDVATKGLATMASDMMRRGSKGVAGRQRCWRVREAEGEDEMIVTIRVVTHGTGGGATWAV
jgi:hypothetical protein